MAQLLEEGVSDSWISVTGAKERSKLERLSQHQKGEVDYSFESLATKKATKHLEPFLVEFHPRERSDLLFTSHEGEEFLFVLEGRVEFRQSDRIEVLGRGDSIYFNSDIDHSFRSLDKKPAKAVAVVWSKLNG